MTDLEIESLVEKTIEYLQDNGGHLTNIRLLPTYNPDSYGALFNRLLHSGLIGQPPHGTNNLSLTEKGWEFESFDKIREDKKLQRDLLDSNIAALKSSNETNLSVKELNTETKKYYQQQDETNKSIVTLNTKTKTYYKWQKWLTISIAVSTAIYTLFAIKLYNLEKQGQSQEQYLQSIKHSLNNPRLSDSQFRINVKEILKTP